MQRFDAYILIHQVSSIKLLRTSTLLPDNVIIVITFNILYVYLKLSVKLNIIISLLST